MDNQTKICPKCNKEKDKEQGFYKHKTSKDGFAYECKKCCKARSMKYDKVKRKEYMTKFTKMHPTYMAEATRKYRLKYPEKAKASSKKAYENRTKKDIEKWYDYFNSYMQTYKQEPTVKIRQTIAMQIQNHLKKGDFVKEHTCFKCNDGKHHNKIFCFVSDSLVGRLLKYQRNENTRIPFELYKDEIMFLCQEHIYKTRREWKQKKK